MTIFEQLRGAMAATLKVPADSITERTRDEDLASWDSLGHINLMMTLEQTFDLALEVEDFEKLRSVAAMIEYLKGQGIG
jgi:acyl carrier protein